MGAIITQKQNNKPWTLTWKASGRYPMVADRIYATLEDAQDYVDDLTATASATPGLVLSVVSDPVAKNNGIYYVQSIAQAATETTEFVPGVLVAAGAGAGSEAVANYAAAVAAATSDNLGQILYVTNPTYKKGEGTTLNPDEADADEEGNKIVVYTAGPYIVTGSGAVAKLGTTSATGDIAGDVENLKGRMSTAEGEIDTLQAAVADETSGLAANAAAIKAESDRALAAEKALGDRITGAIAGGLKFIGVRNVLPNSEFDGGDGYISADSFAFYDRTIYAIRDEKAYPLEDLEHWEVLQEGSVVIVDSHEYVLTADPCEGGCDYLQGKNVDGVFEFTEEIITFNEVYSWEELGNTTVEGQEIDALQALIDADKAASWTTGAEQAATLTASIGNYALKTEVASGYVAKDTGKSLVSDTLIAKLDGLANIKSVDANSVLSVNAEGALTADLSGYVAKDGSKVLSTNDFTNDLKTKLDGVATGAQVNVIETIKVNGSDIAVENKAVNIDLVNHLTGKVSINGQVLTETEDNGVLAAVVDASDIYLGAAIGDHVADATTVQSMLSDVYDIANSKIGSIHLAAGTTSNVLALSKTNIANDTIELKIASGSAITATANGLDLVWTEL